MHTLSTRETAYIFGTTLMATNFLVIAIIVVSALLRGRVGHRRFLWIVAAFAFFCSTVGCSSAWDIYHHHWSIASAIFRASAAGAGSVCIAYLLVTVPDLRVTLKRTEFSNNLKQNEADDREQGRLQMSYTSAILKRESEAGLRRIERERPRTVPPPGIELRVGL